MASGLVEKKKDSTTLLQMVSFHIGEEEYAVETVNVQEIIRLHELTRVPKTPPYLKGVINLRGKIIPIIDLRCRLKMDDQAPTKESRIVIVDSSGKTVGLIVDAMSEVIRIPESAIRVLSGVGDSLSQSNYISGVAKLEDRLLIILDLENLLDENILKEPTAP
jgi:purine-binding chemotaxis protein CheW